MDLVVLEHPHPLTRESADLQCSWLQQFGHRDLLSQPATKLCLEAVYGGLTPP